MRIRKIKEKKDFIEIMYKGQVENLDKIIINKNKEIKDKMVDIDINEILKDIENEEDKIKIKKLVNNLEDNYGIKISEYNREMYKKGFIDGINIILECLM